MTQIKLVSLRFPYFIKCIFHSRLRSLCNGFREVEPKWRKTSIDPFKTGIKCFWANRKATKKKEKWEWDKRMKNERETNRETTLWNCSHFCYDDEVAVKASVKLIHKYSVSVCRLWVSSSIFHFGIFPVPFWIVIHQRFPSYALKFIIISDTL